MCNGFSSHNSTKEAGFMPQAPCAVSLLWQTKKFATKPLTTRSRKTLQNTQNRLAVKKNDSLTNSLSLFFPLLLPKPVTEKHVSCLPVSNQNATLLNRAVHEAGLDRDSYPLFLPGAPFSPVPQVLGFHKHGHMQAP